MFVNTRGGDQNPLPRRKVELCEKYGQMLADAVRARAEAADDQRFAGPCGLLSSTWNFPMRPSSRVQSCKPR